MAGEADDERGVAGDAHGALRRQLLIELSVLRKRYSNFVGDRRDGATERAPAQRAADGEDSRSEATATGSDSDVVSAEGDTGALGQSDRDAIEALFNSVDDFTRDFNEGKGVLERSGLISRITRDSM